MAERDSRDTGGRGGERKQLSELWKGHTDHSSNAAWSESELTWLAGLPWQQVQYSLTRLVKLHTFVPKTPEDLVDWSITLVIEMGVLSKAAGKLTWAAWKRKTGK